KSPISNHPFDKWGIVVGQDKHFKLWMVGQAGGREVTDTSVPQTAARELLEETGGYMKVSSQTISQLPYIYGEKKQLFVLKTNSTSLAANIKQSVQAAQKNPKLNRHFKEIDDITVVSINNFLRLAQKLDQNKLQPHQFTVKAQDGKVITLQSSYTKIFGHKFNHNQYKYAQLLFQSLCK
ncbi:MAG TPA: NUDIX hydrolase, partial [Candidatus Saccharimonadales bacterium]|nr:NUDIX hydrolase [Candidatus Saccharimonadales bacterium]